MENPSLRTLGVILSIDKADNGEDHAKDADGSHLGATEVTDETENPRSYLYQLEQRYVVIPFA